MSVEAGDEVYLEWYGMYHAKFGGIGGDIISLTIAREAWDDLGKPEVLTITARVFQEEE